jgi:hypothetical protein
MSPMSISSFVTQQPLHLTDLVTHGATCGRDVGDSAPVPPPVEQHQTGRDKEDGPNENKHQPVGPKAEPRQGRSVKREHGSCYDGESAGHGLRHGDGPDVSAPACDAGRGR